MNNPKKKRTGEQQEVHERIVQAGIESLGLPQDKTTDLEELLKQATNRIQYAKAVGIAEGQRFRDKGLDIDEKVVGKLVTKEILSGFVHFTKDELLHIYAMQWTQAIVKTATGFNIDPK